LIFLPSLPRHCLIPEDEQDPVFRFGGAEEKIYKVIDQFEQQTHRLLASDICGLGLRLAQTWPKHYFDPFRNVPSARRIKRCFAGKVIVERG
jgi:hypothetical protein